MMSDLKPVRNIVLPAEDVQFPDHDQTRPSDADAQYLLTVFDEARKFEITSIPDGPMVRWAAALPGNTEVHIRGQGAFLVAFQRASRSRVVSSAR